MRSTTSGPTGSLNSTLPTARFDIKQLSHEKYLHRGGENDNQNLQYRPFPHVGVIVQNECVVARFIISRVCLVHEHGVEVPFHRRNGVREVVHVHVQVFDFLSELFPLLIPDDGNVQVDQLTGEPRELIIDAHGVETSHGGTIRIIARCLPLVRMDDFTARIAHRKSGHAISSPDNVEAYVQRAALLDVLVVAVFFAGLDVYLVVHRNSWHGFVPWSVSFRNFVQLRLPQNWHGV